jgi:uncharacterized protein YlbG (UPF0298 family)
LKEEFLSDNYFIFSGYEKRNKLITHNGMVFRKTDYKYAILPYINTEHTNKTISELSEHDYLQLCLNLTKKMSTQKEEEAE